MTRYIRAGDRGPAVIDVQQRLSRALREPLVSDGDFGPVTLQAVRRFQRERRLPADGVVGPETWRSLVEAGWGLGDRLLWHSRRMMRGDDVRELQHRLNQLGFDAGPEDGIFGPLARAAIEEFQRNVGLDVDGVAGPGTLAALRRLLRSHQSGGVGAHAREREGLRTLGARGLVGAKVLVDPAYGPAGGEPLQNSPQRARIAAGEVTWQIAARVAGRLSALGAHPVLSRGPNTDPSGSERARLANEQGVAVVLSVTVGAYPTPAAAGASTYYFASPSFVSYGGLQLAQLVHERVLEAGWRPDCRVHPMTWSLLRETRMAAVVTEPGFLTSPPTRSRLTNPQQQQQLAAALVSALRQFFDAPAEVPTSAAGVRADG